MIPCILRLKGAQKTASCLVQHQCFFEGDQAPDTRCGATLGYPKGKTSEWGTWNVLRRALYEYVLYKYIYIYTYIYIYVCMYAYVCMYVCSVA